MDDLSEETYQQRVSLARVEAGAAEVGGHNRAVDSGVPFSARHQREWTSVRPEEQLSLGVPGIFSPHKILFLGPHCIMKYIIDLISHYSFSN